MPEPEPGLETVSLNSGLKVAVTDLAALIVTSHSFGCPATGVQLVQPVKAEPAVAVAVSVTTSLSTYSCSQPEPEPQLIVEGRAGLPPATVPEPEPGLETVSLNSVATKSA